jgi:hypothetical protein
MVDVAESLLSPSSKRSDKVMEDSCLYVQCSPTYWWGKLAEQFTVYSYSTYRVLWPETGHMIAIDVWRVTAGYQYPFSGHQLSVQDGLSGLAVQGVGLRPLVCWDCGFESRRGIEVCCEYRVLSGRGLCDRPNHSSRGVLPSVVCLSVIRNLNDEKA